MIDKRRINRREEGEIILGAMEEKQVMTVALRMQMGKGLARIKDRIMPEPLERMTEKPEGQQKKAKKESWR